MESGDREKEETSEATNGRVWVLVDHSVQEAALVPVARQLEDHDISVELVTITEVIGSVAREALAGGAERILRGLRVAMRGRSGDEDLVGAFRQRRPDVLVVSKPRYVRAIGVLENLTGVESLQVGLVPDFVVDPNWFNGQLQAFIVPDERSQKKIVKQGFPEERVLVAGPALRPGFRRSIDREKVRKELGFGEEQVVLVRGDGFDSSVLEKLVFQCTLADRDARFVFHHDSDGATAATLRRAADQYGLSAAMFGRVADLERYVVAADAVLAADGDPYLAELIQAKTPVLFVPSGREEVGNATVLTDDGLADRLDDIGQLGTRIDRFLKSENLEAMRKELEGWDGADKHDRLVEALKTVVEHAALWRRPVQAEEPPTPDADSGSGSGERDQPAEPSGPFESIGRKGSPTKESSPSEKDGSQPSKTGAPERDFSGISQAEAKEQLAQLILKERDHERQLDELSKQQERWRGRLQLAREWKEDDLAEEAESILRGYMEEARPLEEALRDIRLQKEKLKSAARGGSGGGPGSEEKGGSNDRAGQLEERFQKMEVDRDLEGLRDRIKRELGE